MGNSPTRSINYTPRMTQWEAWELLWPEVRAALGDCVISFDAYAVYRYQQKHDLTQVLHWIESGNLTYAKRDLIKARGVKGRPGYVPPVQSTVVACRVKPLRNR